MRIHIIGIAGVMTAPLAAELARQKHLVTGSDQDKIYPPVSTILHKSKIRINKRFDYNTIDLFIVGSSYKAFTRTKDEYNYVKKHKLPSISATKYIAKFLGRPNQILIAGSHGKTTISSLATYILITANLKPSYMFGGESKNKIPSLSISKSDWSVLEADESVNGLDTKAKFLYYPVKYLLLTAAAWEHKDSYKSDNENFIAFQKLISRIPAKGFLLFHKNGENNQKLAQSAKCPVYSYGSTDSDFKILGITTNKLTTQLKIQTPTKIYYLNTKLIGLYNYDNILASFALSYLLNINPKNSIKAIKKYSGIKRRLDIIAQFSDIIFIDDFAQSPLRIKTALESIYQRFPQYTIKVFFEPHASFLSDKPTIALFKNSFITTSEVILSRIKQKIDTPKENRIIAMDYTNSVGDKLRYLPLYPDIINHYQQTLKPHQILVHFSSGGLDGIKSFRRIINYFKKHTN